jgi:adenosylmethionine-8-amino-7-oxononanoate aminotransferase
MTSWFKKYYKNIWLPYTQMKGATLPLPVKKTKGVYIYLEDGRKLLDGIASWWSAAHGYNHPHIEKAMHRQLRTMPHIMFGGLAHKPAYQLAGRLCELAAMQRVFFSDSGSTAVEVALKMAVQYQLNQGQRNKVKIISFKNAYHGDTIGAMSICDPADSMHHKFAGLLPQNLIHKIPENEADFIEFDKFLTKAKKQSAAIIIEPLVQAAGGIQFHSAKTLQRLFDLSKKHGLFFIVDECATGFYRTGKLFAHQEAGIKPDIIILGKALTGGAVGLAATITSKEVFDGFLSEKQEDAFMHGPTFMANPLACSAANASLDLFEKTDMENRVAQIEQILKAELSKCTNFKNVKNVRVKGAIGVVEMKKLTHSDREDLKAKFLAANLWLRPFGNLIYIMPAFTIKDKELRNICTIILQTI